MVPPYGSAGLAEQTAWISRLPLVIATAAGVTAPMATADVAG